MSEKKTLFVRGLDPHVTEQILYAAFIPFGDVIEVILPKDHATGSHKGFAFVEFDLAEDAREALDNMHLAQIYGKVIECNLAKPAIAAQRSNRAIWTDEAWLRKYEGSTNTEEATSEKGDAVESNTTASEGVKPVSKDEAAPLSSNPRVYFDINIDGRKAGTIVMELRADIVPKTVKNFVALCTHSEGFGFKNSPFHRIIKEFMCQGGDFTHQNGTGGHSMNKDKFKDENFILKHSDAGVLSMANAGPHTNGSQFFITCAATPWLDGKHVVFGRVVQGMNIVRSMEKCGSSSGKTSSKVIISDCGIFSDS